MQKQSSWWFASEQTLKARGSDRCSIDFKPDSNKEVKRHAHHSADNIDHEIIMFMISTGKTCTITRIMKKFSHHEKWRHFWDTFQQITMRNNCFCKTHPRLRGTKWLFISLVRQLMVLTYTTLSTHQAQYVQIPKQMLAINCTVTSDISKGFNA